ncbi:MAG TPA: FkbM family methyltransferase [Nitrososphaeraceae archaeon]|nr:FkbM family methyltransferase [Nitrososphaeraceae archaeon]
MGKLTVWLTKQEPIRVVPILDKVIVFLLKIIYLFSYMVLRLSIRITLGKKTRDRVFAKKAFAFNYEFDVIPSLYMFKFLYSIIKFLRLDSHVSLKISVPKYGYKAYCPINKNDLINMTIREDEIIEHFTPKQGDIVVDIGAHIGRYTIIGAKRVGANGKVVAIEANPSNFEMLNRNIKLNQLTNILSLNNAVYSKETKIKLYLPGEELGHTIYNTVMSDRAKNEDKFVEVSANTLDYFLQLKEITDVNWIKIDVEGAEFEVLKGATNVLSKSKDIALLIEIHNLSGGTNLYRPILEFLRLYNFKIEFEKSHDGGEKHIILRKQL